MDILVLFTDYLVPYVSNYYQLLALITITCTIRSKRLSEPISFYLLNPTLYVYLAYLIIQMILMNC